MSSNTRLFFVLWAAGMAGVLSLLLIDLSALIAAFPRPEGELPPDLPPPAILKLVTMIQPGVLMSFAVLIGMWLAPKIGLHSPAAEAFARKQPVLAALRPQIAPGLVAGLGCGIAIVLTWIIAKPYLSPEFVIKAEEFNQFVPHAVRMLYGGLTEEILLRWGVMTFLVWLQWRVFQRFNSPPVLGAVAPASGDGVVPDGVARDRTLTSPHAIYFLAAILVSAVVFGLGHLPVASVLAGRLTVPLVIYVLAANSIFGIVAGFLYWRRGLEAAMLAHMSAHVVLIAAIYLAL